MSAIINGIKAIWEFIVMIQEMIIHFFQSLIEMFKMLYGVEIKTIQIISTLPTWLTGFAMATLSVCIIYMLVGRNTGK